MESILQDIHVCQLISSTSNEQVSFFTKHYFRVPPQHGRGHFRGLHISMLKIILSFIIFHQLWPPIQLNLDQCVRDLELCVDCCTVGKVNQDWRLPLKPAQGCPWKRHGVPNGWPKIISESPKAKCEANKNDKLMIRPLTSPNIITL